MGTETKTLIEGFLTFLSTPISPNSTITWGFLIAVILIIYLVSTMGGKN